MEKYIVSLGRTKSKDSGKEVLEFTGEVDIYCFKDNKLIRTEKEYKHNWVIEMQYHFIDGYDFSKLDDLELFRVFTSENKNPSPSFLTFSDGRMRIFENHC